MANELNDLGIQNQGKQQGELVTCDLSGHNTVTGDTVHRRDSWCINPRPVSIECVGTIDGNAICSIAQITRKGVSK